MSYNSHKDTVSVSGCFFLVPAHPDHPG